jgi:hypothetical protein
MCTSIGRLQGQFHRGSVENPESVLVQQNLINILRNPGVSFKNRQRLYKWNSINSQTYQEKGLSDE